MQLFNLWLLFLAYPNWIGQEPQLRNCASLQPLVAVLGLSKLDRPRTATAQLCKSSTSGCCSWPIQIGQAKNSNHATVQLFNLWLLFLAHPNWIGQEPQLRNCASLQTLVAVLGLSKLDRLRPAIAQLCNSSTFGCCSWPIQIGWAKSKTATAQLGNFSTFSC